MIELSFDRLLDGVVRDDGAEVARLALALLIGRATVVGLKLLNTSRKHTRQVFVDMFMAAMCRDGLSQESEPRAKVSLLDTQLAMSDTTPVDGGDVPQVIPPKKPRRPKGYNPRPLPPSPFNLPPPVPVFEEHNGLRKVKPYMYEFQSFAKERWQGRTLIDV